MLTDAGNATTKAEALVAALEAAPPGAPEGS